MSTAYSSAKQQYIGNGVTTEWGFDFPIQKHSELKVYLKRSRQKQVLLEEGVDYSFVAENTIAFPINANEAKLQATDVLALQRESVFESEYNFSNQQRLEPEEVMHADDNLERQIQELKRDSESAIKVQPTSNINTDEYFIAVESIYENLDNINNVSEHSSDIITCSDNISDISTVSSNIDNVNAVGQSISNVNTVANNISDVNTAALNIEAIKDAPNQANAASQSASDASQYATNAANSATASANSATDSASSATASATSAQAAQNALNDVQGLIATPIGTIFQSIYVDESLDIARQLSGQLISSTKFTGFRSWLNTVQTAIPNLFTTESNWQAEKSLSKFGQCGKFVIDDTAQTIRLPAVVNPQGLLELSGIGNLVNESLPNIKGYVGRTFIADNTSNNQVFISNSSKGTFNWNTTQTTDNTGDASINASLGNTTYQDNAPVQQEAVQYPYYIQVATGVEETLPAIREYEINTPFFFGQSMYSDVAPDNASWLVSNGQYNAKTVYPDYYDWLNGKIGQVVTANGGKVVLSTDTYTDYDFVVNQNDQTFRLPLLNGEEDLLSDRKTSLTIGATGSSEIAPANGFYCLHAGNNTNSLEIYVGTSTNFTLHATTQDSYGWNGVFVNVSKGDRIEYHYSGTGTPDVFQFIYAQGNGSLYYYVGDTVQDASLINAGAVLGQLANKADIDASNFNAEGKSLLSGLGMPSGKYIDLTLGASGSTYTAPANGYLQLAAVKASSLQIYNKTAGNYFKTAFDYSNSENYLAVTCEAHKGDVLQVHYGITTKRWFRFYYAEGDKNV